MSLLTAELTKLGTAFVAGGIAGSINVIAGGGTLISFPLLMAIGLDARVANATNSVGLISASLGGAYEFRREFASIGRGVGLFVAVSFVGSIIGAILLARTPSGSFAAIAPFLLLFASLIFGFQTAFHRLSSRVRPGLQSAPTEASDASRSTNDASTDRSDSPDRIGRFAWVAPLQLLTAVYGGYFGAGMGIIMLVWLAAAGVDDHHRRNAVKNLCAFLINLTAVATYVAQTDRLIDWPVGVAMGIGAFGFGLFTARIARKLNRRSVEILVVVIGVAAAIWSFAKSLF